ncbi:hypothetical protein SynMINOS11_00585 [Synechococcus sp. Minos11]|nr:hypothetical protein SynMINOS11_00585 [Synechococcus sp. Minos11]
MSKQAKRGRVVVQQPIPQSGERVAYVEYMLGGQFRRDDIEAIADLVFLPGCGTRFR